MPRMCQGCKLSLEDNDKFCPNCGNRTRKFTSTGKAIGLICGFILLAFAGCIAIASTFQ